MTDADRNWRALREKAKAAESERDTAREELRRARVQVELLRVGYDLANPIAQLVVETPDVRAEDVAAVLGASERRGVRSDA